MSKTSKECWLFHRWSAWQHEPDPSPYQPDWSLTWRVCQRCGQWEWKPSIRERVTMAIVSTVLIFGLLAWPIIGAIKLVEWLQ